MRTAEGHVESLRNKLGVNTRAEVAAWVVEHLRPDTEIDPAAPPKQVLHTVILPVTARTARASMQL